MPIYEYECPECGIFEAVQKVSEKPLKANPDCQKKNCPKKAKRLLSASAFHLKGTGWYKTDYSSSKSGASEAGKSKGSAGAASSGSGAGSDAPATSSSSTEAATSESSSKSGSAEASEAGGKSVKKAACSTGCGCH